MGSSLRDDERGAVGTERVAVWILVVLVVGFTVAIVIEPGVLAASPPDASFEGTFDPETNTLEIEHAGGEPIRDGATSALVVVVTDSDGGNVHTVVWVSDDEETDRAYPVESGDDIAIDDAVIDSDGDGSAFDADATVGFELDEDDTVSVVWRGRPLGAPEQITTTLDEVTISTAE